MISPTQMVGSGMIGASTMALIEQAGQGVNSSFYGQLGIATAGLAMFLFFDKRERAAIAARNDERRTSDKAKDDRIAHLEAALQAKTEELIAELKRRNGHG